VKALLVVIASVTFAATGYEAAVPYFSQTRSISIGAPEKQNYVPLDADVFAHARPDLSDVRIYDGQAQVPYVSVRQSGGSSTQESQAKLLNLGSVAGRAEFDIDTSGFDEYDRVRLQLNAKNFINSAQMEGRRTPKDKSGTNLGTSTLYDFTKEGLGSNFTLKFSAASFPYLHVRLGPGIRPDEVKGAYLSSFSETKAAWTNAGQCNPASAQPKATVYQCAISTGMPVERVAFSIPASSVNFNRTVVLSDEHDNEFQRSAISRVRMNRAGQMVTSEDLDIDLYAHTANQISISIENGDDPPLPIETVKPLSVERRLYFDPKGKSSLQLYYGDPKLEAPSYDYAKFFQQSADAAVAKLGPAQANPQYAGRPDDRPWSERHTFVLWAAMVLAVVILGALAIKGLKGAAPAPR
jgi:hypothetical protein